MQRKRDSEKMRLRDGQSPKGRRADSGVQTTIGSCSIRSAASIGLERKIRFAVGEVDWYLSLAMPCQVLQCKESCIYFFLISLTLWHLDAPLFLKITMAASCASHE
jgi:hypothetical protein